MPTFMDVHEGSTSLRSSSPKRTIEISKPRGYGVEYTRYWLDSKAESLLPCDRPNKEALPRAQKAGPSGARALRG